MNSKRLSELRYKGHITDSEYKELRLAIETLKEGRPTGRWTSKDFDEWYECSNCLKGDTYFDGLPNFCPNCGAEMRGKKNE